MGSILYSQTLYERVEGYYSTKLMTPDMQFMHKILVLNPSVLYLRQPLFCYRVHDSNQLSTERGQGAIKMSLDMYSYTFEYSSGFLSQYGQSKAAMIDAFLERDCLRIALYELARGSRLKAIRYVFFALATYPAAALKNAKTYLALAGWLTGPVGQWLARIGYEIIARRTKRALMHEAS